MKSLITVIIIALAFLIGCWMIAWTWQEYIRNNFDADRYELLKINTGNNDAWAVWKLDKRAGTMQLCTKTNDPTEQVVCLKPIEADSKDYNKALAIDSGKGADSSKLDELEAKIDALGKKLSTMESTSQSTTHSHRRR